MTDFPAPIPMSAVFPSDTPPEGPKAKRAVVKYSPELGLLICQRIAEGETLEAICQEQGMPVRTTFHRWVIAYPELGRAYAAARELSAYALEEEALEMGRRLTRDPGSAQKVRAYDIMMNQLRWSAARRNPRVFSEKGTVQVTVPIQINTSLDLNSLPQGGTDEFPDIFKIDLEATVVTDEGGVEPQDSADRVDLMSDTNYPPLEGKGTPPPPLTPRQAKAAARREHFKTHGAKGKARRKDIISGEDT